jgi:hypothetical protein
MQAAELREMEDVTGNEPGLGDVADFGVGFEFLESYWEGFSVMLVVLNLSSS